MSRATAAMSSSVLSILSSPLPWVEKEALVYPLGVWYRCASYTPQLYPETTMSQPEDTLETRAFTVEGMTCAHCVLAVREEVSEVPGVSAVDVDLPAGRLTVSGERVDENAVRAAVTEAGYEVAR